MRKSKLPRSVIVLMTFFLSAPVSLYADSTSGAPATGTGSGTETGTGRSGIGTNTPGINNPGSSTDIDSSGTGTTRTQDGAVSPNNPTGTSQNRRRTPSRRRGASSQPTGTTDNRGDFNTNNAETRPGASTPGMQQQPR